MTENVVSLRGEPVRNDEQSPIGEIIEDLEELLERARRGEIVAIGAAVVIRGAPDCSHKSDFVFGYDDNSAHDLLASIVRLRRRYEDYLFADADG